VSVSRPPDPGSAAPSLSKYDCYLLAVPIPLVVGAVLAGLSDASTLPLAAGALVSAALVAHGLVGDPPVPTDGETDGRAPADD
jgi:hypothetical protein